MLKNLVTFLLLARILREINVRQIQNLMIMFVTLNFDFGKIYEFLEVKVFIIKIQSTRNCQNWLQIFEKLIPRKIDLAEKLLIFTHFAFKILIFNFT